MAVRWGWVRRRYRETPPLLLLDELRDAKEADELILRSLALGSVGRASDELRDLERASAQDGDDAMLQISLEVGRAANGGTARERIDLANRLWDAADSTPDPAVTRRMTATTALRGTKHGSPEHRMAADRLVAAASGQLDQEPQGPGALYVLAVGYWELGDRDAAASTLNMLHEQGYPPCRSSGSSIPLSRTSKAIGHGRETHRSRVKSSSGDQPIHGVTRSSVGASRRR